MSGEKKKYDIVGTVSIGTDEYRDLIEAVKDAEAEADKYRSSYWNEQNNVRNLTKQVEALNKKAEMWESFLADHSSVQDDWHKFLARKMYEGTPEEEN